MKELQREKSSSPATNANTQQKDIKGYRTQVVIVLFWIPSVSKFSDQNPNHLEMIQLMVLPYK